MHHQRKEKAALVLRQIIIKSCRHAVITFTDTETITHAPGPIGLPGGYPILVNAHDIGVVLLDGLMMQEAVDINEACMRFDGIERIDEDGTVSFTKRNMSILKEMLDYECKCMPLSEAEQWAAELRSKFLELVSSQR